MTQATKLNLATVIEELEDLSLKGYRIDEDSAAACLLAAKFLKAADRLLDVANEYYDESDCHDARLDDAMAAALTEYEALK